MRFLAQLCLTPMLGFVSVRFTIASRELAAFSSSGLRRIENKSVVTRNHVLQMSVIGSQVDEDQSNMSEKFLTYKSNEKCSARPTTSDVERISWGKPAKKKGTGSRGVPHRLNEEERNQFDMAIRKGFLQIHGSGWRKQRRGSPILNSWRNWCDARCHPAIVLHKSTSPESQQDSVVIDLSPLRTPTQFDDISSQCEHHILETNGRVATIYSDDSFDDDMDQTSTESSATSPVESEQDKTDLQMVWDTNPIYHLSPHYILWEVPDRTLAKGISQSLASLFCAPLPQHKKTNKPKHVKHGKNRRHGGYGI